MYSVNDIEVFIASHNRPQFIEETIKSFLVQSVKGLHITVLDNSDNADVINRLADYKKNGVEVIPANKNEPDGMNNFARARNLANKKWVMIFHDDDIIHPQFMEHILSVINKSNPELVASFTEVTIAPSDEKWQRFDDCPNFVLYSKQRFVTEMFKGIPVPFCSILYRTEMFKKQSMQVEEYGKVWDRPFVYDCIGSGKVALMKNVYVQTRVHGGRDTDTYSNGPFKEQWYALMKKYKMIMGDSPFSMSGRTFLNRGTRTLLVTMNPHIYDDVGKKKYVEMAIEKGAISKLGYYIGLPYCYLYIAAKKILKLLNVG